MKTTIEISEKIMREAKKYAVQKGLTLKTVIETALRNMLDNKRPLNFKLKKISFRGQGLQEGLQESDWSSIRGKIYKGRGE